MKSATALLLLLAAPAPTPDGSGGLDDTSVVVTLFIIQFVIPLLIGLLVYFVPTYVARRRKKEDFWAIAALNVFLGWSIVGWVGALVWALMKDRPKVSVA